MIVVARRALLLLVAVLSVSWFAQPAAVAHPLGNFTVNRYTGILVSPDQLLLDHVIDLAEIPTAQLGDRIEDLDGLSQAQCRTAAAGLELTVAGERMPLQVVRDEARTSQGDGGLPVLRVSCRLSADVALAASTDIRFSDRTQPGVIGWREVIAIGDRTSLTESDVPTTSVSDQLRHYPEDLLASPLDVSTAALTIEPGGPPASLPEADATSTPPTTPGAGLTTRAASALADHGMLAGVLALLLSLVLGATHALAPGHGKTVMAFYLSQRSDSSIRAALGVGTSVTLAHTGSVLGLGILVTVGAGVVPTDFYPWLGMITAGIIIVIGAGLLRGAVRGSAGAGHGHGHGHDHDHDHDHGHDHGHGHRHGHTHEPDHSGGQEPAREATDLLVATRSGPPTPETNRAPGKLGLVAMGLVGGLVPSPSALILLLASVAAGRAWFGTVMVLFFGLGMAATLATVGLLARDLLLRLERLSVRRGLVGRGLRTVVAYGAALSVCTIGVVLATRSWFDLI